MKRFFTFSSFTIGFCIIAFFAIPAIPGYLITPDQSPNANEIISEISNRNPGFSCNTIRIKLPQTEASTSWMEVWLHGRNQTYSYKPISQLLKENKDSILVQEFESQSNIAFAKADLVFDGSWVSKKTFRLGTDRFGRDVLSRIILGSRVSLFTGLVSVIISLIIGVIIGMLAGYMRGNVDAFLSWLIAVFWSVPTLLIALGLSFVFGKGLGQVLIAIGLSTWVEVARVVRGQTMQLREKEFILAARITGFSTFRILFKHILPNLKATLTVLATTNFASAILLEAGLSFLGLGIEPPAPSWGIMVKEHLGNLVLDSAYLALIPGAAIMLLVTGFNFLSMGIRDAFDSRLDTRS